MRPRVAVFSPNPLLGVTIERRGDVDDVHLHPGGQGVWVARMAAEAGATPVLCGLMGDESGDVLRALLEELPGELRLIASRGTSGCYVVDRRTGERRLVAQAFAPPASRHEVDDLISETVAAALDAEVLAVCNPFPAETVPLEVFEQLVSDVRANGTPVLVDLSSPRLDSALAGRPDLVKLNDWELAQYLSGPVEWPDGLRAGAERLLEAGAASVLVTRGGESALALRDGAAWELVPPNLPSGYGEGCGDTMMGALSAAWARDEPWPEALVRAAAAGAANFLRHGLGSGHADVVADLAQRVRVRELPA